MCVPNSPKCIAKLCVRIGFGVALALFGIAHLRTMDGFRVMVSDGLGPLAGLGTLWAYILPLLQIGGGVLLVANYRLDIAAWCAGIALASIAIGMPLKAVIGGVPLGEVAPAVNTTLLWLLVYLFVVKGLCCDAKKKEGAGSAHACPSC